jgi:hypothetical protein
VLDADETLRRFLIDGRPDARLFDQVVGGLVRAAVASGRPVCAYGEMVARLWDEGRVNSAIELEALRNHLGLRVPFSLFCSYPSAAMTRADHAELLSQVCCSHTAVVGGGPQLRSIKRFDLSADAPRASRRFVIETLAGLDCKPLIDEAALVVTELAANAVLQRGSSEHAGAVSARRRRPRSLHHRRRGEHVGSASHRRGQGRLGATPARPRPH